MEGYFESTFTTSSQEIGNSPYPSARRKLARCNIGCAARVRRNPILWYTETLRPPGVGCVGGLPGDACVSGKEAGEGISENDQIQLLIKLV